LRESIVSSFLFVTFIVVECVFLCLFSCFCFFFFFNDTATTEIYTLSLHDALPISSQGLDGQVTTTLGAKGVIECELTSSGERWRSEEHTSELQSRFDLVCRLLLEKKKKQKINGKQAYKIESASRSTSRWQLVMALDGQNSYESNEHSDMHTHQSLKISGVMCHISH